MTIGEIRQFVEFISNKTQSGTVKTSQFNLATQQAQFEFFNKQYRVYQTTKEVTDALRVWLKSTPIAVNRIGQASYPSDYMRMSALYKVFYNNNESTLVEVVETNDDEIGGVLMSQIVNPTAKYPRVVYYDSYMQVYPKKQGTLQFNYFRQPTRPIWNYTVVNGRQVYDPATSIDLEVLPEFHTEICSMICSYIGINLREGQLIQYSEMLKTQRA